MKSTIHKDVAHLYLLRPQGTDVWYLSAYEFFMYWTLELARYPCADWMVEDAIAAPEEYECELIEQDTQN